jgi:hypothetical protein
MDDAIGFASVWPFTAVMRNCAPQRGVEEYCGGWVSFRYVSKGVTLEGCRVSLFDAV